MCAGTMCDHRRKPTREKLQEAVNHQTVSIAQRGVEGIDELKRRALESLRKKHGITGLEEIADDLASAVKRALLKGLSK